MTFYVQIFYFMTKIVLKFMLTLIKNSEYVPPKVSVLVTIMVFLWMSQCYQSMYSLVERNLDKIICLVHNFVCLNADFTSGNKTFCSLFKVRQVMWALIMT